jgi:hypothetical protein
MNHCVSKTAVAAILVGAITCGVSTAAASAREEITNFWSGKCLDGQNDSSHNPGLPGDRVQLWQCAANGNANNQNWVFSNLGGWGTITIYVSGLCLDAANDSTHNPTKNGDKVQLWTCNGSLQQQWHAVVGNSVIENAYGLVLDAENDAGGNPNQNGDAVQLWQNLGSGSSHNNQHWSF